jgi:hypothetical protein
MPPFVWRPQAIHVAGPTALNQGRVAAENMPDQASRTDRSPTSALARRLGMECSVLATEWETKKSVR